MEQHPIPQNVTTFQFRLIGDMTIKQFGYLLGGAILAYISYKLPLPFFFTWPLAGLFALGGIGFAFVPVEDRPMDVWVLSFFRNVYSPTLFVWEKSKQGGLPLQAAAAPRPPAQPVAVAIKPPVQPPSLSPSTASVLSSILLPKAEIKETPAPPPVVEKPKPAAIPTVSKKSPGWLGELFALFAHKEKPVHVQGSPLVVSQSRTVAQVSQKTHEADVFAGHVIPQQPSRGPLAWLIDLFKSPTRPSTKSDSYTTGALFSATPVTSITGTHIDIPNKDERGNPPVGGPAPTPMAPPPQDSWAAKELEEKIGKLEGELKTKEASDARVLELQKQLMDAMSQTARNEAELTKLRAQMQVRPAPQVFRPAGVVQPMPSGGSTTVRVVPQESATKIGLPHQTAFPNIITGVVKDDVNNLLPNVLITVRDKEDVPLRALKSNKLGQFAASTPLSDGTYVIEVEDPRRQYAFDRVQITLKSNILPAIEIIAKNQKRIDREKLAAQVFGQNA